MGRCGRAGNRVGRGLVFYGPSEEELVKVVQEAEEQQERMVLPGDVLDSFNDENDEQGKESSSSPPIVAGTVNKAFSRKRGFTKKLKKVQRGQQYEE